MDPKQIKIESYNYQLPDDRIAKYPLANRDESKLLLYHSDQITETQFKNIASYLPADSLIVANNTKVIRARMEFYKESGARIEVFCLEPYNPSDYNLSFECTKSCDWLCIVGNLKKWKHGILAKKLQINNQNSLLTIERTTSHNTESQVIRFTWDNPTITFSEIIENSGTIPIPPYLNRAAEKTDLTTYQTIYSKHKGSVAAPTAGLHFTNEVFKSLEAKRIKRHEITLHVGAGTFIPVKSEEIGAHKMHTEHFVLTPDTLPPIIKNLGNITAVGTTTVRSLESFYWLGVKLIENKSQPTPDMHINQWDSYKKDSDILVAEALGALHQWIVLQRVSYIFASTSIIIAPGYTFKVVDRLITNFHQPKSTLLLLVSAFVGKNWQNIYNYALQNNFRFLSYGDSCLLENKKGQ